MMKTNDIFSREDFGGRNVVTIMLHIAPSMGTIRLGNSLLMIENIFLPTVLKEILKFINELEV